MPEKIIRARDFVLHRCLARRLPTADQFWLPLQETDVNVRILVQICKRDKLGVLLDCSHSDSPIN